MESIGPQLPPSLRKNKDTPDDKPCSIGPILPPHLVKPGSHSQAKLNGIENETEQVCSAIGPQIFPSEDENESDDKNKINEKDAYGPCLPPSLRQVKKVIGPSLPPLLTGKDSDLIHQDDDTEDEALVIGPALPGCNNNDLDEKERIRIDFEKRAESMKDKLTGKSDANKKLERESWMTDLPDEIGKNFGLGPRTFRAKAVDLGDRSVWTDTPADRERKRKEAHEKKEVNIGHKRKDVIQEPTPKENDMQDKVEEYNKKTRPQSLLEIHQEKRKKTGETSTVRRPFDRDRDLAINRTDAKEKRNFIAKAKELNTKFSKGNYESKFL